MKLRCHLWVHCLMGVERCRAAIRTPQRPIAGRVQARKPGICTRCWAAMQRLRPFSGLQMAIWAMVYQQ